MRGRNHLNRRMLSRSHFVLPHVPRVARFVCVLSVVVGGANIEAQAPVLVPQLRATQSRLLEGDFTYAGAMAIGPDGNLLVTQPADGRLLLITTAPQPISIGRRGEGPNEFRTPGWVGVVGSGYWVYDPSLNRITFIDRLGKPGQNTPVEAATGKGAFTAFRLPSLVAVITPDSLLFSAVKANLQMMGGLSLEEKFFLIASPRTLGLHEVAQRPAALGCGVGTATAAWQIPNCPIPLAALRPDGRQVVTVTAELGKSPVLRVTSTTIDQRTKYTVALPITPKPIPAALHDSMRAVFVKRAAGAKVPPMPKVYNPLGQLVVSNEGEVWVEQFAGPGVVQTLWRISATGKVLGKLQIPRFRLRAASGDTLWGTTTDEDGVIAIVQYRVTARAR